MDSARLRLTRGRTRKAVARTRSTQEQQQQQQLGYAVDGGESEDDEQKKETRHNKNNNQTDYVTGVLLRVTMVDNEWSSDGDGGYGR